METFSLLHALPMSFFSKPFYRDVGRRWRWRSFFWLFLLLAVAWVPRMFMVNRTVQKIVPDINAQIERIPNISIVDGQVSADVEQPYFFTDETTGETLGIIDTTGAYTSLSDLDKTTIVLLTEDSLHTRTNNEMRQYPLDNVNFELTSDIAKEGLQPLLKSWWLWALPFVILGTFIYRLIGGLLLSMVGLVVRKERLSYGAVLSLSLMALTPAIVLNTVLGLTGISLPFSGLIMLALSVGYLVFGLRAQEKIPNMPMTPPGDLAL